MAIVIKSRNVEVTDTLRRYAERKLSRLARFLPKVLEMEVELIAERNPSVTAKQIVEVTLRTEGATLRAKESSPDMHASIDLVSDKLERRIKRYKGRLYEKPAVGIARLAAIAELAAGAGSAAEAEEAEVKLRIVKTKQMPMKPMTPEEATIQMELVGHDFFVFRNAETGEVNVVYRRKDQNYGLIGPAPE